MADQVAIDEALRRSQHAERLLRDDLLKEAFDKLDAEYTAFWRNSTKPEDQLRIWHAVNTIAKVRAHLFNVLNTGKIAQRELDHLVEAEKRRKFRILP